MTTSGRSCNQLCREFDIAGRAIGESGADSDVVVTRFEQAGCSSSTQELSYGAYQVSVGDGVFRERGVQVRAAKGPPKQGRGYNSKKAAAEGIRKIMRGRESDGASDGWTEVRPLTILSI